MRPGSTWGRPGRSGEAVAEDGQQELGAQGLLGVAGGAQRRRRVDVGLVRGAGGPAGRQRGRGRPEAAEGRGRRGRRLLGQAHLQEQAHEVGVAGHAAEEGQVDDPVVFLDEHGGLVGQLGHGPAREGSSGARAARWCGVVGSLPGCASSGGCGAYWGVISIGSWCTSLPWGRRRVRLVTVGRLITTGAGGAPSLECSPLLLREESPVTALTSRSKRGACGACGEAGVLGAAAGRPPEDGPCAAPAPRAPASERYLFRYGQAATP